MIHCNGPVRLYCVLTWFGELCEQLLLYNYALLLMIITSVDDGGTLIIDCYLLQHEMCPATQCSAWLQCCRQLSPGIILMSGVVHDTGILQS